MSSTTYRVVHIDRAARFGIFPKSASRQVPVGWVGLKSFGYRCHFRAFQLELDTLDTQNIGNGPVVEELQPFEVGRISIKSNGFKQTCIQNHHFVFTGTIQTVNNRQLFDPPQKVSTFLCDLFRLCRSIPIVLYLIWYNYITFPTARNHDFLCFQRKIYF